MERIEKKKLSISNFLDDLWTACAEGTKFKFDKTREKYSVSQQYTSFVKNNCVDQLPGTRVYRVRQGWNKDNIAEVLSKLSIKEMGNSELVLQKFQSLPKKLKHTSPTDTITKVTRFDQVEADTKKEVIGLNKASKAVEIDDLSQKPLPNARVIISVRREYPGGSDATSFEVKEGMTYSEIVSLVNPLKK